MEGVSKDDFRELDRDVGKIGNDVSGLKVEVHNLNASVKELVSKAEFFPVKVIVYGLAGGAMTAVLTAVITNVIVK